MAQSSKVARIYRARENLLEHLAVQQGYLIEAKHHKSITDINNGIAEPRTLNFKVIQPDTKMVTKVVYALTKDKLDKTELERIYETHFDDDHEATDDDIYGIENDTDEAAAAAAANAADGMDGIENAEGMPAARTHKKPDQLIILTTDEPNDTIESELRAKWQKDKNHFLVVISLQRLQFNIMKHVLVPPHERLTSEAADAVRRKYNITSDKQFPEISRFSPVAQVIGLRPGELTRILRPSKTAIQSVFYRLCSN